MGVAGTAGGGGMLAMLFAAASLFRSDEPVEPVVETVTNDGAVFVEWELDKRSIWDDGTEPPAECTWNNGSVVYKSDFCSHFSLTRLASSTAAKATDRAARCAAAFETECVLSPEIGVSLPAAFVPRPGGVGMRMLVAPRIVASEGEKHIKVEDPTGAAVPRLVTMNHTIEVEFLAGGSRTPVTEVLHGTDAYCVQLLRKSFVEDCWDALD